MIFVLVNANCLNMWNKIDLLTRKSCFVSSIHVCENDKTNTTVASCCIFVVSNKTFSCI